MNYIRRKPVKHPKWIPLERSYVDAKNVIHNFPWEWIGSAYVQGMMFRMYRDTRDGRLIFTDCIREKQGFQVQNLYPPLQEEVKQFIALQKLGIYPLFGEGLVGSRY